MGRGDVAGTGEQHEIPARVDLERRRRSCAQDVLRGGEAGVGAGTDEADVEIRLRALDEDRAAGRSRIERPGRADEERRELLDLDARERDAARDRRRAGEAEAHGVPEAVDADDRDITRGGRERERRRLLVGEMAVREIAQGDEDRRREPPDAAGRLQGDVPAEDVRVGRRDGCASGRRQRGAVHEVPQLVSGPLGAIGQIRLLRGRRVVGEGRVVGREVSARAPRRVEVRVEERHVRDVQALGVGQDLGVARGVAERPRRVRPQVREAVVGQAGDLIRRVRVGVESQRPVLLVVAVDLSLEGSDRLPLQVRHAQVRRQLQARPQRVGLVLSEQLRRRVAEPIEDAAGQDVDEDVAVVRVDLADDEIARDLAQTDVAVRLGEEEAAVEATVRQRDRVRVDPQRVRDRADRADA